MFTTGSFLGQDPKMGGTKIDSLKRAPLFTAVLFCWFLLCALWGTTVRTLDLFEMVRLADRVFSGKCLSAQSQWDETVGFSIVEYTFEVLEAIKGVQPGGRVVFRQIQSVRKGVVVIPGIPHYQKGQEILLFLHRDSRSGLTSPVGLGQGIFQVKRIPGDKMGVISPSGNRNLVSSLNLKQAQQSGLSVEELQQIQNRRLIPLEIFASVVKKIDRYWGEGKSPR